MDVFLNKLERRLKGACIHNLMLYIVLGMLAIYLIDFLRPGLALSSHLYLDMGLVAQGQVWRLITFIFLPPATSIFWLAFSLYFYYLIGSALEGQWGSFKFNIFYLVGILGSILSALLTGYASNTYLNLSLFFAFAILYPDFQMMLFFFIPIKIKYLAILDAVLFLWQFIMGGWSVRISILFALANVALFFFGDAKRQYQQWKRRRAFQKNWK